MKILENIFTIGCNLANKKLSKKLNIKIRDNN